MIYNSDVPVCPCCNAPVKVRDSRIRRVKDADGNLYIFRLRRLKCEKCGRLHIEIPDMMMKNKHYSKTAIDAYLYNKTDNIAADNKTLYRWRKMK